MIEEISPSKGLLSKGAPFENFKYCMGNIFFEDFHVKKQLHVLGILFESSFLKTIFKGFPPSNVFMIQRLVFRNIFILLEPLNFLPPLYYSTFDYFVLVRLL